MLYITVPDTETFDEETERFIMIKGQTLKLEHSLVSLSKWESKWHVPFFSKEKKTSEQLLDYIKCMTLTQNVDDYLYYCLTEENMKVINDYIENPMTATWFNDKRNSKKQSKEVITSELIYYWMVASQIPFECQKWHINRLLTLIRICGIKNAPPDKMTKKDIYANNTALNAARRKALHSKG